MVKSCHQHICRHLYPDYIRLQVWYQIEGHFKDTQIWKKLSPTSKGIILILGKKKAQHLILIKSCLFDTLLLSGHCQMCMFSRRNVCADNLHNVKGYCTSDISFQNASISAHFSRLKSRTFGNMSNKFGQKRLTEFEVSIHRVLIEGINIPALSHQNNTLLGCLWSAECGTRNRKHFFQ